MSVIDGFKLLTCSVAQKGTESEPRSKTVLGRRFALDQAEKEKCAMRENLEVLKKSPQIA